MCMGWIWEGMHIEMEGDESGEEMNMGMGEMNIGMGRRWTWLWEEDEHRDGMDMGMGWIWRWDEYGDEQNFTLSHLSPEDSWFIPESPSPFLNVLVHSWKSWFFPSIPRSLVSFLFIPTPFLVHSHTIPGSFLYIPNLENNHILIRFSSWVQIFCLLSHLVMLYIILITFSGWVQISCYTSFWSHFWAEFEYDCYTSFWSHFWAEFKYDCYTSFWSHFWAEFKYDCHISFWSHFWAEFKYDGVIHWCKS
jgi:hypothetical protein